MKKKLRTNQSECWKVGGLACGLAPLSRALLLKLPAVSMCSHLGFMHSRPAKSPEEWAMPQNPFEPKKLMIVCSQDLTFWLLPEHLPSGVLIKCVDL